MHNTGTILLENQNGVLCSVVYFYDQALDNFKLFPSGRYTNNDVETVMRVAPSLVKAIILNDIMDKMDRKLAEMSMSNHASASDRPMCGVSEGR